ncbi:protealysin inhibitor emfourin [Allosphingosinicella deserti]|uniref:Uncharacterized protein n=1 Tax=Allosphingosinicella deserti TaxID=2116704 RepID=A0A2P7QR75_9SPHN|nr:protealysin inhibitor emfourin [Sphingomonas deserti]PSJ40457.1 hypothetical protein C7I55_08965 [Sphingomonas deserti]
MAETGFRIRIVQQGGFAGTIPLIDVDGHDLPASDADAIANAAGELTRLAAAASPPPSVGADLASYAIEVERNGGTERFVLRADQNADAAETGSIRAIIARLRHLSAR